MESILGDLRSFDNSHASQIKKKRLRVVQDVTSELRVMMDAAAVFCDEAKYFFQNDMVPFIQKFDIPFLYKPYMITAASLMLQLKLMIKLLHSTLETAASDMAAEKNSKFIKRMKTLLELFDLVSCQTLPFCSAVSTRSFSQNPVQFCFIAESGARDASQRKEVSLKTFDDVWRHIVCDQTKKRQDSKASLKPHTAHVNNICFDQYAAKISFFETICQQRLNQDGSTDSEEKKSIMDLFQALLAVVRENAITDVKTAMLETVRASSSKDFDFVVARRRVLHENIAKVCACFENDGKISCLWMHNYAKYGLCFSDRDLSNEESWERIQNIFTFLKEKDFLQIIEAADIAAAERTKSTNKVPQIMDKEKAIATTKDQTAKQCCETTTTGDSTR
jgi:hypothetical protein